MINNALTNNPEVLPKGILVAQDLRKSYGARSALKGLSFTLQAGRVLGFLGPNGAGKTTSIRILTTILEPDSGHFFVDGYGEEYPNEIRRRIGVLPEGLGFPKQMTSIQYLTFFGQLYGLTEAEARTRAQMLLEQVGLAKRAQSMIGSYSHGMRQRLGIARALVNDPSVVFLDEPTLGLDPAGQQELLAMVRWIARERNAGVILCSHLLAEIEGVCDDVVILNLGQVIATGTVAEVISQAPQSGIRIGVAPSSVAQALQILATIPQVIEVIPANDKPGWLTVELVDSTNGNLYDEQYIKNNILDALVRAAIPVLGFEAVGSRLQDVFLHLTKETAK